MEKQSTNINPKQIKIIQQHLKILTEQKPDTYRHIPDKVRSVSNLSIFVHIRQNSGTDTGRHADIQFL